MPIHPAQLEAFRDELEKLSVAFGLEKDLKRLAKERGLSDEQINDLKSAMGLDDVTIYRNPKHTQAHSLVVWLNDSQRKKLKGMEDSVRRKELKELQKALDLHSTHVDTLMQGKSVVVLHGKDAPVAEVLAHELGHIKNKDQALWRNMRRVGAPIGAAVQLAGAIASAHPSAFLAGPLLTAAGGFPIPLEERAAWIKGEAGIRATKSITHEIDPVVRRKALGSYYLQDIGAPTAAATLTAAATALAARLQ